MSQKKDTKEGEARVRQEKEDLLGTGVKKKKKEKTTSGAIFRTESRQGSDPFEENSEERGEQWAASNGREKEGNVRDPLRSKKKRKKTSRNGQENERGLRSDNLYVSLIREKTPAGKIRGEK